MTGHNPDPSAGEPTIRLEAHVDGGGSAFQAARDMTIIHEAPEPGMPRVRIGPAVDDGRFWRGGSEVACGPASYLVHDPVETTSAADRSWVMMQAHARGLDSQARRVWIRGLLTESQSRAGSQMAEGLNAQATYLTAGRGRKTLPELVSQHQDGNLHIVVIGDATSSSWSEWYGSGLSPLDPLMVPLALDALAGIADALVELHRSTGHAHRALDGESIRVAAAGRRGVLRDVGLAWWPWLPGEGGAYRAPEQRSMSRGQPGPPTDVFQLAALLQRTCCGFTPDAGHAIPLKTILPAFPERLDRLLAESLDPDPGCRPSMTDFATGLRQGRRNYSTEATA